MAVLKHGYHNVFQYLPVVLSNNNCLNVFDFRQEKEMKKLVLIVMSLMLMISPVLAQETEAPAEEAKAVAPAPVPQKNYDAKIEALEKQIADLKAQMNKPAPAPAPAPKAVEKKEAPKSGDFVSSIGNYIQFYGRARLDYSFDTSRTAAGATWAFWVLPNYDKTFNSGQANQRVFTNTNDYESNISARNSRFGFKLKGTDIKPLKAKLSGRFELDFNGGDIAVTTWKALPRMRIAALTLDWGWFAIMGGNHWDTFSTHVHCGGDSNTANALMGSVGFRRPQLRFSFKPMFANKHRIWVEFAIARPFDIVNTDLDGDGNNDGEDSAIPQLQGRIAYEAALWTKKAFMLGVGAHWQRASLNAPVTLQNGDLKDKFNSWHVDVEMMLPIMDNLFLRGEFFYGQMMADIMGGIFQDINPETFEEIKGMGGWADITYAPFPIWAIVAGFSVDKPDEDTMQVTTVANLEKFRYWNSAAYLTNKFNFGSGFTSELTYMWMRTKYRVSKDPNGFNAGVVKYDADNHRILFNIAYNF